MTAKTVINAILIGHVDAGKSTLGGQISLLLDLIDERTLQMFKQESEKLNRESWYLSWALDVNPEERLKGKTTELGKFSFPLPKRNIVMIDAPGHALFQNCVISGASQSDLAILIISAKDGEFESGLKGQTMKHVVLVRAMGVSRMLVLINKMDDQPESRYNEIKEKLLPKIQAMYKKIDFIPISGYKNINVKENSNILSYYNGPSLLEYLNDCEIESSGMKMVFFVNEKIKNMSLLCGKVESGFLKKNDQVLTLPGNILSTIVNIYDDEEVEINEASEGMNVRLKIKDFNDDIQVITTIDSDLKVCTEFSCTLKVYDPKSILSPGYRGVVHIKNMQRMAKILNVGVEVNGKIQVKKFVRKGEKVLARVVVDQAVVVYDGKCKDKADWFLLRDEGRTVAIGQIKAVKK